MRASLTILAALLLCSCGGKVDDPNSGSRNSGVTGVGAEDRGTGGAAGNGEGATEGEAGSNTAGGTADPGVGGSEPGGACPTAWWGGTLDGVTGVLACRDPWDPAILAYGQTQIPSDWTLSGPLGWKHEGGNLACQYRIDYSDAEPATYWLTIPYFGDGLGTTVLPDSPITTALQSCSAAVGPVFPTPTQQARADSALGVWVRCSGTTPEYEGDGLILRSDGTWHTLQSDADGRLALTTGCRQGGLWGFDPWPGQINFHIDDGTMYTIVRFHDGGTRMVVEGISIDGPVDYVKVQ